jgi:hypothetical protein
MTTTELHDCFLYVDCDIPAGMTIAEWRRDRHESVRPARRLFLRHLLHRGH